MCDRTASLAGLKILIVDRDADSRMLLNCLFADYGVATRTADSVDAALAIAQQWPVDLLISEIGLPGKDGYTLVRQLPAGLPAIALTGYVLRCDRNQALSSGFDHFLGKPVDIGELLRLVHQLTGRKEGSVSCPDCPPPDP